MAETILDRLNLMFGSKPMSNLPKSGRDIDFARRLYPQPGISDAISGSGLGAYISGEKGYPKPRPMTSQPDTIAGEIGKGIYNIGIGPGLEALRLITAAPNEIPALGSAIGRSLALPSRGAYNQELTGIAKALASQRGQDEGSRSRALAMQKAMLAGDDPRANRPAFVGGPTYQQIPTSAEADAGLNAEIKRLQELSQVAEDQDMGLSVGSDTDVALGRAGLVPSDPTVGDEYTELPSESFLGTEQDVQFVEGDDQLTSRIKDIISDDATVSDVGAKEGDSAVLSDDSVDPAGEAVAGDDQLSGMVGQKSDAQQEDLSSSEQAFKSGYDAYLEALGESAEIGTIDDYKKEFADATGIDISGKVDNKAALMAFGLALMQNKAGKGFNVGNILSSVGEAGEAALPLMAQAKKEARAAKLAGGKYALEQRQAAKANRQALLEAERDRINELQKTDLEYQQKLALKKYQHNLDVDLKRLEHEQTLFESEFEGVNLYLDSTEEVPLFEGAGKALTVNAFKQNPNLPKRYKDKDIPLKLTTSARTLRPIFDAAEKDLNRLEDDLAGIAEIALQDGITVQQQAAAGVRSLGRAFGINVDADLSPLEQAKQTLKRIEVRRTAEILGEAGKTISDADRALVTQIVGEIGGLTLTDLTGADAKRLVNRLSELHEIIVVKGRSNLDTARQRLTGTDYDVGASGGGQQSASMEVGDERDIGGVMVKRTG